MIRSAPILLCAWLFSAMAVCAGEIHVVPLKGEVSEAQFFFLRRALKEAERENASAVILDMDTYGGSLSAAVEMQDALSKTRTETITFIHPNAGSAGALIAVSTKRIYMAPVSAIGAAAPVMSGGQDLPQTMTDKVVSYFSGYFRSAAERNGHNPDIAEAFINKEKEVKLGDTLLHAKGSLLTLSAQEAVKIIAGKPVLSLGIAEDAADVAKKAGLNGALKSVKPAGFEQVAFWITMLGPLFLLGGIIGAYIEIKTPGFGLPGTVSIICFVIFFTGHYIAGLAGWEVFVLFFAGLLLVVSEVLLHPGTIIPGLLGVVLVVIALLMAMVDRYPSEPWWPSANQLVWPVAKLSATAAVAAVLAAILARYLPKTSFYHRAVLATANPTGPSLASTAAPRMLKLGAEGIASTMLRPSGRASFGELHVDVVTEGDFIPPGAAIRVIAVEGSRIIVENIPA
jgi:membrane-bound serine protease (ClpP class)